MKNIKTYIKYTEICLIAILLSSLFISTLYYFNILSNSLVNYLRPLIIIISVFICSYKLGKNAEEKGYLEGIKFGGIITIILLIISLLFYRNDLRLGLILYYIIIISISMLASMIGISKKKS